MLSYFREMKRFREKKKTGNDSKMQLGVCFTAVKFPVETFEMFRYSFHFVYFLSPFFSPFLSLSWMKIRGTSDCESIVSLTNNDIRFQVKSGEWWEESISTVASYKRIYRKDTISKNPKSISLKSEIAPAGKSVADERLR